MSDASTSHAPAVLTTVASDDFTDQAKALFAAAHTVGGWRGDYLLLGMDLSEANARWFTDRGIAVQHCSPVLPGMDKRTAVIRTKLRLFEPAMRQWSHVVFLDCDIIVRGSLAFLAQAQGFNAVHGIGRPTMASRFTKPAADAPPERYEQYRQLTTRFNLNAPGFNGGVYAFSTDVIADDTFDQLVELVRQFGDIASCDEEPFLGLYFLNRWRRLPKAYNTFVHRLKLESNPKAPGMLLHFMNTRVPWRPDSPFHAEWLSHLQQADAIDFRTPWPNPTGLPALPLVDRINLALRDAAYRTAHTMWHALPESIKRPLRRIRP